MHLIIPFASVHSEAGQRALGALALPQLEALLQRLGAADPDLGDDTSLSPPHERALAGALGLRGGDGMLPWAAHAAAADGIEPGSRAMGLVTPVHWQVGLDQVSLLDPQALDLHEDESRTLLEAVRGLFEGEGWTLQYGAPLRWYAAHASLEALPCASLDRVIGRSVDPWMRSAPGIDPEDPRQRLLRRLQNEVQMQLHEHVLNERREQRGAPTVNSFWLSGCGRAQPVRGAAGVQVDDRLRSPALAEDWPAWIAAWAAFDAGPVRQALQRSCRGEPVVLTLCGERHARPFGGTAEGSWSRLMRRWRAAPLKPVLEAL